MNVKINGDIIKNITTFDNDQSIIRKYAINNKISKPENVFVLPGYLRIENHNNDEIIISNIFDDLVKIDDARALINSIDILSNKYVNIGVVDIVNLWIISNYDIPLKDYVYESIKELGELNKIYSSIVNLRYILNEYVSKNNEKYNIINETVKKESSIYKKFEKLEQTKIYPFVKEQIKEKTVIKNQNNRSIYDIFDEINATIDIPFILLKDDGKTLYKVYTNIKPDDEWIEYDYKNDGIYLYVRDSEITKIEAKEEISKFYSFLHFSKNNTLISEFNVNSDIKIGDIRNKLFSKFSDITIDFTNEIAIGGVFVIPDKKINKAVFADLITNNKDVSLFIYLDESEKSYIDKPRFTFYYNIDLGIYDIKKSLTITITELENGLSVRISRARSLSDIANFISVFSGIYSTYEANKDVIINTYKMFDKTLDFKVYDKKYTDTKDNKKTGKRLKDLQEYNSIAFSNNYSTACQPRFKQPYIVKGDATKIKIDESVTKDKTDIKNFNKKQHGILNWPLKSDDWYSCYPREDDDKKTSSIWPGLVKAKSDEHSYKYLPCCFVSNQYTKNKSNLVNFLKNDEDEDENDYTNTHILKSTKLPSVNRLGELPYYIRSLAKLSGYTSIKVSKNEFLPIVRLGMISAPDSFIHCMEYATNDNYKNMNKDEKISRSREVLNNIAKMDNYAVSKQELYDRSDDEIRSEFLDITTHINPKLYISIIEKFYKCNVIVINIDKMHPDGDIMIPRHVKCHLNRKLKYPETVVLTNSKVFKPWVYQTSIVVNYNESDYISKFSTTSKFVKLLDELRLNSNSITISSSSDYII